MEDGPRKPRKKKANVSEDGTQQLLVTLVINGDKRDLQFASTDGTHYWVVATALSDDLEKPVESTDPGTKQIKGQTFVDPTVRFPGAKAELSADQTTLSISLPGAALGTHTLSLNEHAKQVAVTSSPSAFINYSLSSTDQRQGSAYVAGGLAMGGLTLNTSSSWNLDQKWRTGPTFLTYDDPTRLRRWTLGDQVAFSTDGTGGGVSLAGVGLTRAFDLDPYLITQPQPSFSGVLQAPGTVDIYRNGQLIAQRNVPAGAFNLTQLGLGAGQNNIRVVIQDPFGGQHELQQSFYATQTNLEKGLSEYAYQVGIATPQPGYVYDLAEPELLARHRWGFTDWLSAGYRVEAEKGFANGGLNTDLRLPVGALHFAAALSHDSKAGPGWGGNFSYSASRARWSLGLGGSLFSDGYRRLGDRLNEQQLTEGTLYGGSTVPVDVNGSYADNNPANGVYPITPGVPRQSVAEILASTRQRFQGYGTISYSPFGRLYFQASYVRTGYADRRVDNSKSLSGTYNLPGATFTVSLNESRVMGVNDRSLTANLTIPLGRNLLGASHNYDRQGQTNALDFQRSQPNGTGYGYTMHVENGRNGPEENFTFSAEDQWARLTAQGQRTTEGSSGNLMLSGGVVLMDRSIHFSAPLDGQGYALVKLGDDLKGISVVRENQVVGTTDAHGRFLVTSLLAYQNNTVGFHQQDIPLSETFEFNEKTINVPRYGGTVVDFGVRPLRAIRGILSVGDTLLKDASLVSLDTPARKGKKAERRTVNTPIGSRGNFFVENVPAGDYTLEAQLEGRLARCPIIVPPNKSPMYDLKKIACTWVDGSP